MIFVYIYQQALDRKNSLVTFEVILRVQDLVKCNFEGLHTITWDLILQITSKVLKFADSSKDADVAAQVKIMSAVNDTLTAIEDLLFTKCFCGQIDQFFNIVDSCYLYRPVSYWE